MEPVFTYATPSQVIKKKLLFCSHDFFNITDLDWTEKSLQPNSGTALYLKIHHCHFQPFPVHN